MVWYFVTNIPEEPATSITQNTKSRSIILVSVMPLEILEVKYSRVHPQKTVIKT
jgi:hypothetical protein